MESRRWAKSLRIGRLLPVVLLTFVLAPALSQSASAADAAGCKDPAWAAVRMTGYEISSCEDKPHDAIDLDLPSGGKTIHGHRTAIDYSLRDGAKDHAAAEVRNFYVAAAQKAGAQLMSDPSNGYAAALLKHGPAGEVWYLYDHGSGNEDSTGSFTLTTLTVAALKQEVEARAPNAPLGSPGKTCADPPWLKKQFAYFKLSDCGYRDFDSVALDLPDGQKTLVGRAFSVNYQLTDPSRDPTALTVKTNFVNALKSIGAKEMGNPDDAYNAILMQKTANGDFWYIYQHGSGNEQSTTTYSLLTLEVGGPPPKACTLEVYGVNFDFNKAVLRPDSEPVLRQVLTLFTAEPNFAAEVGGHTDNIGGADYNLKLSAARANAVRTWLMTHGIAQARMTAKGYGDSKPLAPNTSDANRAKNRRVELKRAQCQ